MTTLTIRKSNVDSTACSNGKLMDVLISSGFPCSLLRNASSELNLDGEVVKDFISKAQEYAGNSTGFNRAKLLTEFVNKNIPYDSNRVGYPILEDVLSNKSGGVCLHKAAALHLVLAYEGWNAKYEGGVVTYKDINLGTHAWLSLDIDGVKYLSDPTNMLLGKYHEFDIKYNITGISQLQIVKHYGPFNILRKKTSEVKIIYQNFWNMNNSRYAQVAPEALKKAAAAVAPFYSEVTKTLERYTNIISEKSKGKVIKEAESELAKVYSLWLWASKEEVERLNQLVLASSSQPDSMQVS